ncbi:UNVERIFIED_CONTAM: hypothetical protein HDU68_000968 [Siphonaria sp. JEL0065]|nr:hypothetical protein HDU68_000968 [Siphonaria sp. JEL0065]
MTRFLTTPLDELLTENGSTRPPEIDEGLKQLLCIVESVPGYKALSNLSFESLPFLGKRDFDLSLSNRVDVVRGTERCHALRIADVASTLVVVALPMGSWVGGLYLAQKGYKISVIAPGNNMPEIAYRGLSVPLFPTNIAQRAGISNPLQNIVSIYGTADCGVLANETILSATVREYLAARPQLLKKLFGKDRIPSFMQYDPLTRFFEKHPEDGTLVNGVMSMPLVRYCIGDDGGVIGFSELLSFLNVESGGDFDVLKVLESKAKGSIIRRLPFVWVFGRAFWTVSLYGANVYVENVMVGLEQPKVCLQVTGKFVLAVNEDPDDVRLLVHVELAAGVDISDEIQSCVVDSILNQVKRLNSEFANYVPADKQVPIVKLYGFGDTK